MGTTECASPIASHEQWHNRHHDLVDLVLATTKEHAEAGMHDHPRSVGNLSDELWAWMQDNLPGVRDCCDCEVAVPRWVADHPDGTWPARAKSKSEQIGSRILHDVGDQE